MASGSHAQWAAEKTRWRPTDDGLKPRIRVAETRCGPCGQQGGRSVRTGKAAEHSLLRTRSPRHGVQGASKRVILSLFREEGMHRTSRKYIHRDGAKIAHQLSMGGLRVETAHSNSLRLTLRKNGVLVSARSARPTGRQGRLQRSAWRNRPPPPHGSRVPLTPASGCQSSARPGCSRVGP